MLGPRTQPDRGRADKRGVTALAYTRLLARSFLDWVAPRDCASCDEPLEVDEVLFCTGCARALDPVATPLLLPPEPRAACFAFGGPIATAIRRMKFSPRPDLAPLLGRLLAASAAEAYRCRLDLVVPHALRGRRRALAELDPPALAHRGAG